MVAAEHPTRMLRHDPPMASWLRSIRSNRRAQQPASILAMHSNRAYAAGRDRNVATTMGRTSVTR
jgi:hypothetical protein